MAKGLKTSKKGTNKGKYSLYLDKDIMTKVRKDAVEQDRSVNYVVEKHLESIYN